MYKPFSALFFFSLYICSSHKYCWIIATARKTFFLKGRKKDATDGREEVGLRCLSLYTTFIQQFMLCYVLNMLYMKAMLCIALALPHSLSHTALNREVLCDHTHLCQVLSQCQTFEPFPCRRPVGFCPPVWSVIVVERGSMGKGLRFVLGSGHFQ